MAKSASTSARCDHIISLIDRCLAEVEADVLPVDHGTTSAPCIRVPRRHLALVRS